MISRYIPGLLALLLGLVFVDVGRTQEAPADLKKKTQPTAVGLDRKVADLEALIGKLTKEVQTLRADLKGSPVNLASGGKTGVSVFALKHAKAARVAKALKGLFPEKDGLTIRIATEPSSNTVLVRGSRQELEMVEALISRLEAIAADRGGK